MNILIGRISLDLVIFFLANIIFSFADGNIIYILLFNAFYLHRFALINHYMQHYYYRSKIYSVICSCLFLDNNSRLYHLDHHLHFNSERDVDYKIYNPNNTVILHLFKICTLQYFFGRIESGGREKIYKNIIASQIILYFIFFLIFKTWYGYLVYYFFPLLIAKVINDLRVFAEHYDPILRTGCFKELSGIPLLNYFISPYGFDDHKTHHTRPDKYELNLSITCFSNNHISELIRIIKYG
jgi:hypothetical protein